MIGFGANEGRPTETFGHCLARLRPYVTDIRTSPFYETFPHYDKPGAQLPDTPSAHYINAVLTGQTHLSAHDLLTRLLEIETSLGRKRPDAPCAPRPADLDLLLYDTRILDDDRLTLPHPRMHLRNFVLVPACDIAPTWLHPVFGRQLDALLTACPDSLPIVRLDRSRP